MTAPAEPDRAPETPAATTQQLERDVLLNLETAEAQAGLGSWAFDTRTGSGWWSRHMYTLLGHDPSSGVPAPELYLDLVHPEDRGLIAATLASMAQGQMPEIRDFRTNPGRGALRILSPQYRVEKDSSGAVLRFFGTVLDITERKRAELALRASEAQYRGLIESLDAAISAIDAEGRLLYMNDVAAAQLSGAADALVGKMMGELLPDPAAAAQLASIRRVIAEDRGLVAESLRQIHGRPRWYRTSIQPIHDAGGRVAYALINATDIHDLKTAQHDLLNLTYTLEERVRARSAEVQDLYENAPNGYHSLDADGRIIRINQTELTWLGYGRDELIGRPFTTIITEMSRAVFAANYHSFMQRGWVRDLAYEFVRKDSSTFPVLVSATAIYDDAGDFVMSRTMVFDNTERKRAEDALRVANAEMERALRAKDALMANMSHELRTPLNAILAMGESLREELRGPLNAGQQEALRHIEASGQHLLTLIDDILDLSKADVGRLDLQLAVFSVSDLCRSSLQSVRELALKKRLLLSFQLNDELADIEADPSRLKQMLINLLSNAVKFTPDGGQVSLEVEMLPEEGLARFSVRDTGIGIAPDDMGLLFRPFTQLDSRLSRQHEGSGLGLALVRRLAELHGGQVTAESELGRGSRFTIRLPYRLGGPAPLPAALAITDTAALAPAGPEPTGAQILLVDDNEVNMEVVREYLQAMGYTVALARTGREALDQAAAIRPALILMDIQMPEMDGLEAIQRLRARPECAATPIIALTALAMAGDRERCLAAGASEYLSKPISLKGLRETIRRLLGG